VSSAIQNILERTIGDGARATKFEVVFEFTNPNSVFDKDSILSMAKAAGFPSKANTTIDFKFKGRPIPLKGQTKFTQLWEVSFYLTEDHKLKNAFEVWIEALDQKHNYYDVTDTLGVTDTQLSHSNNSYVREIKIHQKNFDDNSITAEYTLHNAFPTQVSAVQTSYESIGQIQEFTVIFAYSHFTMKVNKGRAGNFIDEFIDKNRQGSISESLNALGNSINSFIKDSSGNASNELSDFDSGLSKDVVPRQPTAFNTELVSGGLGSDTMEETISDRINSNN
jgi:hypothetical protein